VREATPELIDHVCRDYKQISQRRSPVLPKHRASTLPDFAEAVMLVSSIRESIRSDLSRTAAKLRTIGAPPTRAVLVGKEGSWSPSDESNLSAKSGFVAITLSQSVAWAEPRIPGAR
jgi:hypothetical protein